MAVTLYDAIVPGYLQILGSMRGVFAKGLAHARERGIDPETLVEARLAPDMAPLRFQAIMVRLHSAGALEAAKGGVFSPPSAIDSHTYAGLQALIDEAEAVVRGWTPEAVNALEGRDVAFVAGARRMDFVAEDFLLTFSQPNFYFHAATAYDILRNQGVPIGKRDFLGQLRMKG